MYMFLYVICINSCLKFANIEEWNYSIEMARSQVIIKRLMNKSAIFLLNIFMFITGSKTREQR